MAFGRRKKNTDDELAHDESVNGDTVADLDDSAEVDDSDESTTEADDMAAGPRADGTTGPHDSTVAPEEFPDGWGRIDLGALILTVPAGVELRLDVDENTSMVNSAVVVLGDVALQVMAYAAPRSSGIWDDVRAEIAGQLEGGPGSSTLQAGRFGPELHAHVPTDDGLLEARFMGVDGPRWFLRGVISGAGAHDDAVIANAIEVFAATVVVRDDEARPSQEPLPVTIPRESVDNTAGSDGPADGDDVVDDEGNRLRPFDRGPEITEIR